ncbi:MAG: hypothetical protein WC209_01765 [Ignavibacteriaceae bacterium]|jgi:tetratricopeptide (TPR) repeat protein
MSIWHPGSGITYEQYLQTNSFVKDISGQVKVSGSDIEAKVSKQTKELIASNQQLASIFGESFNSLSDKLEWGLSQIDNALHDVSYSIESLHSDFNYNMALLIDEVRINNKLFTDLLSKLDVIHKTLESPTLTQAREFYHIGCERLSKGLLDKALEAFLEAQKKNDTDFFTQFQIGKLYLYGIDEDDNILNLEEAKKHLLFAARYAKAEISVDPSFSKFAAEALLHASISIYARLGEKEIINDIEKTNSLLLEAKKLTSDAIKLCKDIPESFYHFAKYASLLSDPESSIENLETAIISDRNYAVKVDIDHAFDPIRPYVHKLLVRLKENKKIECQFKLNEVSKFWQETADWHPEERNTLSSEFSKYMLELKQAQDYFDSQTYFGFIDGILNLDQLLINFPKLKNKCIEETLDKINKLHKDAKNYLPPKDRCSKKVENIISETLALIATSENLLNKLTYESYQSSLSFAETANTKSCEAKKQYVKENEEYDQRQRQRAEAERIQFIINSNSRDYAGTGAVLGGMIGSLAGCSSCLQKGDFNLFSGGILGALLGAFLGYLLGQMKGVD